MKYPIILLDVDDTLLDFSRSRREAFARVMPLFGAPGDEKALAAFMEIDAKYWKMLERGEIAKPLLLTRRFEDFFALYGLKPDCNAVSDAYLDGISSFAFLLPGALELCQTLHASGRRLFIVTNGTARAQRGRFVRSGLEPLFERVFISDEIGVQKPDPRFFGHVFAAIGNPEKSEVIILGDSLSSDMRGGKNAGIATCWYNPNGRAVSADCDHEIAHLLAFPALLL